VVLPLVGIVIFFGIILSIIGIMFKIVISIPFLILIIVLALLHHLFR
jgi:hypothetical protein